MAFELEKFFTDLANSRSLHAVFNNPIYTAFIIVTMVLLIIYFTMKNDVVLSGESDSSMFSLMFTSGIYCILAVLGIVYLQHRSVTADFEQKYNIRGRDEIVSAAIDGNGELATLDVFNPTPVFGIADEEDEDENGEPLAEESVDGHNSSDLSSSKTSSKSYSKSLKNTKTGKSEQNEKYMKKSKKDKHKKKAQEDSDDEVA